MSTDYTPTGTTAQPPAPVPSLDTPVIVRLPESTDPFATTAYYQAVKSLAENVELHRQELHLNRELVVFDHFTGSVVEASRWATVAGSPTIQDDSASGGHGALVYAAGTDPVIQSLPLALGTTGFRIKGRIRNTSVDASTTVLFGVRLPGPPFSGLWFSIDGSASTTNWRFVVDNVAVSASGTVPAISSSYKRFEIVRSPSSFTAFVDGVVFHTASYSTNLTGTVFLVDKATTSNMFTDMVRLEVL